MEKKKTIKIENTISTNNTFSIVSYDKYDKEEVVLLEERSVYEILYAYLITRQGKERTHSVSFREGNSIISNEKFQELQQYRELKAENEELKKEL